MPLNSAGDYSMNPQVGAAKAAASAPVTPPTDPMANTGDMTIHPNGDGTFQIMDASGAPMDIPDVQSLCSHIETTFGGGEMPPAGGMEAPPEV